MDSKINDFIKIIDHCAENTPRKNYENEDPFMKRFKICEKLGEALPVCDLVKINYDEYSIAVIGARNHDDIMSKVISNNRLEAGNFISAIATSTFALTFLISGISHHMGNEPTLILFKIKKEREPELFELFTKISEEKLLKSFPKSSRIQQKCEELDRKE